MNNRRTDSETQAGIWEGERRVSTRFQSGLLVEQSPVGEIDEALMKGGEPCLDGVPPIHLVDVL